MNLLNLPDWNIEHVEDKERTIIAVLEKRTKAHNLHGRPSLTFAREDDDPMPRDYTEAEQEVGWLDCLILSYERMRPRDPDAREDPSAVDEMISECRRLAARLRAELPEREPVEAVETPSEDVPW
jgi:hypothetical protein